MEFVDSVIEPDLFMVSIEGQVLSKRTGKILTPVLSKTGYPTIPTKVGGRNGIYRCFKIHRLVASTYVANPYNKQYVNHIDGDRTNNSVYNLEWVTHAENMLDTYVRGAVVLGLSYLQVLAIRQYCIPGHPIYGFSAIARFFNVSKHTVQSAYSSEDYLWATWMLWDEDC